MILAAISTIHVMWQSLRKSYLDVSFVHSFTRTKIKLDHDEAHSSHEDQSSPTSQLSLGASLSLITFIWGTGRLICIRRAKKGVVMEIEESKTI
jgi:hypothetical protein